MNNSDITSEKTAKIISTTFGTIQSSICPWHRSAESINPDDLADWD